jgi:hypothetical protein
MSLPSGWGSIYCSTNFGDWKNIKYSIPFESRPDCLKYIPPVPDYIVRVEADGGTVESPQCVGDQVENLKDS